MGGSEEEREEEEEAATDLLRDKFRLSTISIALTEGLPSFFIPIIQTLETTSSPLPLF